MKVLVTGRTGQVARSLTAIAGPQFEVTTLGRPELDVSDRSSVARAIEATCPDIVVNAAAYTAVDKAEGDEEAANRVNRDGAGNVAAIAADWGLPIVHISTDYVYAGDKSGPYVETDAIGPTGAYGRSKLAGEHAVAAAGCNHVILRTAWVYAPWGQNFVRTMLRLATDRDEIRVVADQYGSPTYAPDIASGIVTVCRTVLKEPGRRETRGIFHMTGGGYTTWAEFAREVFDRSRALGGPHACVIPIGTADYPTPARRPANSRIDNTRFQATFAHALPPWQSGVARALEHLLEPAGD